MGIWNAIFGIGVFYFLLNFLTGSDYRLVLLLSFIFSNLQSHATQRILVWKTKELYFFELLRFFAGAAGFFLINLLLLTFLVDILAHPTFQSQVFITIFLTFLNYFFQKHAVFKSRKL